MTLPSASKDNPTCFLPEQEYSDSLFPLVSMTMTPPSVLYAIFLPQNDEQMTGQSLNLPFCRLHFIEKSLKRNVVDDLLAVTNPSNVFAIPMTLPLTGILSTGQHIFQMLHKLCPSQKHNTCHTVHCHI